MRPITPRILMIPLILSGTLLLASHRLEPYSGAPLHTLLVAVQTARAQTMGPGELFERGRELFEEKRYTEALESFQSVALVDSDFRPREVGYFQLASQLRLATLRDPHGRHEEIRLNLLLFVERENDEWAARAAGELARQNYWDQRDQQALERAIKFWETSPDVATATMAYLDILESLVKRQRGAWSIDHNTLRMWRNLVAIDAPRERMFTIAAQLLSGQQIEPARIQIHNYLSGDLASKSEIAKDVLAMEPPGWLAAPAHLVLANHANSQGKYREALEQARAAEASAKADDARAVELAQQLIHIITTPTVQVSGAELYRPGSGHQLHINWRNLRAWGLDIRRIDPVEDLRKPSAEVFAAGSRPADWFAASGRSVHEFAHLDNREKEIRDGIAAVGEPHTPRNDLVELDPLEPGLYLVLVTGETFDGERPQARHLIQVTDIGLVQQAIGSGQTEQWLVNMDTGAVQPDVTLQVHLWGWVGNDREWQHNHQVITTDKQGLAHTKHLSTQRGFQSFVVGKVGDRPVLAVDTRPWWYDQQDEADWRGFVLSDRPLYRPGETVHLQAFVRRTNVASREHITPTGQKIELLVRAPDGSEFLTKNFTLDSNGSLEFDIELQERPALGQYNVSLRTSDRDPYFAWAGFQVDEYRLPEFTVSAQLNTDKRYVLGDSLRVKVAAEYLFGGAVRGQAEVVVRRAPYWTYYQPWHRYGWLHEASPYSKMPHYGGGEEVLRMSAPLNEDGILEVVVPTTENVGYGYESFSYTIEARVTDSSRREESGSATVQVGRQELFAFLSPRRHVVAPGDDAELMLRIQDIMGRPVSHPGRWTVTSLKDGTSAEQKLLERVVQTGEDGQAELSFKPSQPGYYRITYESTDDRGAEFTAQTTVWCADPSTTKITHGAGALQLIASQDEFLEGDVARVLLVSDTAGVPVYLSEYFADRIETRVLQLEGTVKLLEIPLDNFHRPYFFLKAVRGQSFMLQEATARIVAPLADDAIQLSLDFSQETYKPGDTARLNVQARTLLGDPVTGPFTLAVVDEAVLAIRPRSLIDPNQTFHSFGSRAPGPMPVSSNRFGGFVMLTDDEGTKTGDDFGRNEGSRFRMEGESRENAYALGGMALRDADMPASKSVMALEEAASPMRQLASQPAEGGRAGGDVATAVVRTDFRATALWQTGIMTDADGNATVEVPLAESLTTWNVLAVAITPDTKTGMAETTTKTRKDVMVRLNHPRVFREGDRFLFAATVHNETDEELSAQVELQVSELRVEGAPRRVVVPAHGQTSVEWWADVASGSAGAEIVRDEKSGRIRIAPTEFEVQVVALTSVDSDAFVRKVKVLPWGTQLRLVGAVEATPGNTSMSVELPSQRLPSLENAMLNVSPTVLSTCIDALSYLADYPYGCTEQTISRFVPAVAVRHVANTLGVSSRRFDPELDDKVRAGLRRLADHQKPDGGWGWWKSDESRPYMTSVVLVALSKAVQSDARVDRSMMTRGRDALRKMLPRLEGNHDDMAFALYALGVTDEALRGTVNEDQTMVRFAVQLYEARDDLRDYSRALLASYAAMAGQTEYGVTLLRKLDDTVQRDEKYQTVHWGRTQRWWWRGEGAVETTAFVVEAFGRLEPDHPLRKQAVRWLVMNRKGSRWDNTRATAHTIYALSDYALNAGELSADYTLVVRLRGDEIARVVVTPKNILDVGGDIAIPTELLRDGKNALQLEMIGEGIAYTSMSVDTWTSERDPQPTESWLGVSREVVRLQPRRTLGGTILQIEQPLEPGDRVESGDRLRVRLKLTAHTDLEYLAIEDPRPAGCEPVDVLSGWFWQGSLGGRREVRDELTAFFVAQLSQGEHVIEYELRAESPGTFGVLPALAYGMYLPDVNGSSAAFRLGIEAASELP